MNNRLQATAKLRRLSRGVGTRTHTKLHSIEQQCQPDSLSPGCFPGWQTNRLNATWDHSALFDGRTPERQQLMCSIWDDPIDYEICISEKVLDEIAIAPAHVQEKMKKRIPNKGLQADALMGAAEPCC